MNDVLRFFVQGSSLEPYEVVFESCNGWLACSCTCAAGVRGQHCKHRVRLLLGDLTGSIAPALADVEQLHQLAAGTELAVALREFVESEAELEVAKTRATKAKKRLATAMAVK